MCVRARAQKNSNRICGFVPLLLSKYFIFAVGRQLFSFLHSAVIFIWFNAFFFFFFLSSLVL